MRGKHLFTMLFVVGLVIALFIVGIVQAATPYDLTTAGSTTTINGAIFEAFTLSDPNGGGQFDPFVRISSGNPIIRGYNSDFRPVQFEEDSSTTYTLAHLLSDVPQYFVNGTLYREFQADINQNTTGDDYLESLDELEFYESPYNDLCGYPFDGSGGGHSGCTTNNTATLIWDMDALEDSFVILDHRNNDAINRRDMRVFVPNAVFNPDPNCSYGGVGCTFYITIYSQFGGDEVCPRTNPALTTCPNNDGYEDWGVRVPGPLAISMQNITAENSGNPTGYLGAAFGFLASGTLIFLVLRRRQQAQPGS
jgi:hypothetical protein